MKGLGFLAGWIPVARKEGRATLLSVRLLIIAGISALAVLAGTYAIAPGIGGGFGAPSHIVFDIVYHEDLNASRPALGLFAVTLTGESISELGVDLVNLTSSGPLGEGEVLRTGFTDATGWARFEGLWSDYPNHGLGLSVPAGGQVSYRVGTYYRGTEPVPNAGYLATRLVSLGGGPDQRTLYSLFLDGRGETIGGADIYIFHYPWEEEEPFDFLRGEPPGGWEPYWNGTTDERGFYLRPEPLGSGNYIVRAEKDELNGTSRFGFFAPPGLGPAEGGPDGVLAFAALLFVPLILPVMALVISYDSVARERSEGSLDTLLSKPVSRTGVALGKLSGVFASMALPVTGIFLAAAGLVWALTGQAPTSPFLASLLGAILFLLLVYTLLFLAVSANVRNLGTALLSSILFFMVFAFFWSLISFLVASIFATPGSVNWLQISVALSAFSPSGVYQQLLSHSLPGFIGGVLGTVGGTTQLLPLHWIALAAVLWVAVPLALFLLAMKYRVTEG